jgi:ribosomal protein S18 acetylase RimI-like enzyme
VKDISNEADRLELHHISVRFDADDSHLIHGFIAEDFEKVDAISTFTIQPKRLLDSYPDGIRLAELSDALAVKEISRTAFTVDRFHSDPKIDKFYADKLHAQWGENSVLGKAADTVILAEEDNKIIGFVTCKISDLKSSLGIKIGTIVLVATAVESQGKGIGTRMLKASLNWFAEQGCDLVEVGTQEANLAASKLYTSLGFERTAASVSLRKWIEHPSNPADVR